MQPACRSYTYTQNRRDNAHPSLTFIHSHPLSLPPPPYPPPLPSLPSPHSRSVDPHKADELEAAAAGAAAGAAATKGKNGKPGKDGKVGFAPEAKAHDGIDSKKVRGRREGTC